ncbi:MAG: PAS domain-containing protein [Candidatus Rokubacteria bacterium]|nr:PAS domain-containing protein [Candidatus Rokubacteria bacterium]
MSLRPGRFQGFLLLSAVLIAAVGITAGVIVGAFFERHLLGEEETRTAEIVRSQARQHLSARDLNLVAGDPAERDRNFRVFLEGLPGVFRIKAYDTTGRIVWSNESRLIGMSFPDDTFLQNALSGRVTTVLGTPSREEHVFERSHRYIAEAYVPVEFQGSAGVAGVLETYKDMTATMMDVQRTQRIIWAVAGGIGLFLYGALGLLAWNSSAGERRAISRLERQNRELTLLQQFAQSMLRPVDLGQVAAAVVESAGAGLGFSRAALYRVEGNEGLTLLAEYPPGSSGAAPAADLVADALAARAPLLRAGTVAVALFTPKGSAHLFAGERSQSGADPGPAAIRPLEIMLQEASIALGNAELFTEIREAHERLAAIMASVTDQMVILDREMRVVWANSATAAEVGGSAVGLACFELMGGTPETCRGCPAVRTFHSGTVARGMRARTCPDGKTKYLDLITAPLRDASGRVHQVLEVARDITDMVEMEERLKQANQALVDAQVQLVEQERLAAVGQLVVGLHHAILNPLTGILGILQVLKAETAGKPEQATAIAEAEGEIRKIERLVRRLPDLQRTNGTPYVGRLTMLDLERLWADQAAGRGGGERG